ncbi:hypothetical protein [Mycobacterium tilburgii]|uniref:hypothetical protein n=1 Tax=Mycobacterium tilburgii TaxID=44467 RepID=UPI0011820F32|nr:hypothetical protein [Mycobacterium tilburgii]
MQTIWTFAKAAVVVVGSSAALLTGGIAHADPAPVPDPVQNIPQQLIASAANAPQILQNLATALGAQPPAAPTAPGITFPGMASAAQPPAPAGVPSIPGLNSIPGLGQATPAAAPAAPASTPQVANVNMPALPGLPLNVPPKLSLPGDLTALATGAVPGTAAAATPPAPVAATPPSLLSALP